MFITTRLKHTLSGELHLCAKHKKTTITQNTVSARAIIILRRIHTVTVPTVF